MIEDTDDNTGATTDGGAATVAAAAAEEVEPAADAAEVAAAAAEPEAATYKARYIASLETQLASAQRLAACEAAALALQQDVAALRAEVARLAATAASAAPAAAAASLSPDASPFPRPSASFARATRQSSLLLRQQQQQHHQQQPQQQQPQSRLLPASKQSQKSDKRAGSSNEEDNDFLEPLEFSSDPPDRLSSGQPNTAGYRAWTDIVRIRYPNFQRVTPAMSKAARYFREENNLELVRLVGNTSLKANVTLAIPEHMHAKFLKYMEELFVHGSSGHFGDKNTEPFSSSSKIPGATAAAAALAIATSSLAESSGAGEKPGSDGSAMAGTSSGKGDLDFANGSRKREADTGASGGKRPRNSDSGFFGAAAVSAESSSSSYQPDRYSEYPLVADRKFVISKCGWKLTRYNLILSKLMRDFKNLPKEARVAIKKGVKSFLQHELKDQFEECVIVNEESDKAHTYGIPEHLLGEFKAWACAELQRCFPTLEVLDRDFV